MPWRADGAVRLRMSPLPDDEVTGLLADAFGAPRTEGLMALATEAAGNPSLLVELIAGLRDDDAVRSKRGRAVLDVEPAAGARAPGSAREARRPVASHLSTC